MFLKNNNVVLSTPSYRLTSAKLSSKQRDIAENNSLISLSIDSPLDLTNKQNVAKNNLSSPLKKRYRDEFYKNIDQYQIKIKTETISNAKENTPTKKLSIETLKKTSKIVPSLKITKRTKVSRKLKFDEDFTSPVSGTIIKPLEEINLAEHEIESGDIDPQYNIVEATEEARAEIAAIANIIGDYKCKLCQQQFEDAFELARHRCTCIVLLEYRCPECGKKFNCPANLASHRRWHKPRDQQSKKIEGQQTDNQFNCIECGKTFKRSAYLKKHLLIHSTKGESEMTENDVLIIAEETFYSKDSEYSHSSHNYVENSSDNNNDIETAYNFVGSNTDRSFFTPNIQRIHIGTEHLTEEENIAAAALADLKHSNSIIKHGATLAR